MALLTVSWSDGPGFRGSNELRRYSTCYFAQPAVSLFGRRFKLGEAKIVVEFVHALGGSAEYADIVAREFPTVSSTAQVDFVRDVRGRGADA